MSTALAISLGSLGRWLLAQHYRFTVITPATHQRVNARSGLKVAVNLRDVFGWSRPFTPELLDGKVLAWLRDGDLLDIAGGLLRSRVRFSSLGSRLYAHSSFPTQTADAVFFGPDTYRFTDVVKQELASLRCTDGARILDICSGAGPGGVEAAFAAPKHGEVVFADINPVALDYARANAGLAGLADAKFAQGDLFNAVSGNFDLIIANPPYLLDPTNRVYRNGGGKLGAAISERIVEEGLVRLNPGGRLILYTGVVVVDGVDSFLQNVQPALAKSGMTFNYREIDPDVFGEELDTPAYANADRIAAVALTVNCSCPQVP